MTAATIRADICLAACEGLEDDDLRGVIALGGFAHLVDSSERFTNFGDFVTSTEAAFKKLASSKTDLARLRVVMLQTLLDMEQVR